MSEGRCFDEIVTATLEHTLIYCSTELEFGEINKSQTKHFSLNVLVISLHYVSILALILSI